MKAIALADALEWTRAFKARWLQIGCDLTPAAEESQNPLPLQSRMIIPTLLVAAAVAAATMAPTAGASAACSDLGFKKAVVAAEEHYEKAGAAATKSSGLATAAAEELAALQTLRDGPVPCSPAFRVGRKHQLRAHADAWRGIKAYSAGKIAAANAWFKKATHEMDLSNAALVPVQRA
jgi:hypothetical protein